MQAQVQEVPDRLLDPIVQPTPTSILYLTTSF